MNETIRQIIIDILDIKPSEYKERFEKYSNGNQGDSSDDYRLYRIATRCYEVRKISYGNTPTSTTIKPWITTPMTTTDTLRFV